MTETTNFPELAETIRKNMEPTQFIANRGDFVKADYAVIPHGMEMKSLKPFLDEYRIKPDRRTGTAVADTLPSFIDIANRFKGVDSAVFARAKVSDTAIEASLTAVFNYHPAGGDNTLAQFSDHRAIYHFHSAKISDSGFPPMGGRWVNSTSLSSLKIVFWTCRPCRMATEKLSAISPLALPILSWCFSLLAIWKFTRMRHSGRK